MRLISVPIDVGRLLDVAMTDTVNEVHHDAVLGSMTLSTRNPIINQKRTMFILHDQTSSIRSMQYQCYYPAKVMNTLLPRVRSSKQIGSCILRR